METSLLLYMFEILGTQTPTICLTFQLCTAIFWYKCDGRSSTSCAFSCLGMVVSNMAHLCPDMVAPTPAPETNLFKRIALESESRDRLSLLRTAVHVTWCYVSYARTPFPLALLPPTHLCCTITTQLCQVLPQCQFWCECTM